MTDTIAVYGQSYPAAQVLTDLYTCPNGTSLVGSSFSFCNQAPYSAKVRFSVAVGGAADDTKQYMYYDLVIDPNDTFVGTLGMTLAAADVVRCYSDTGTVSFNLFGVQITP
jgi:hypothetical protein